MNTAKRNWNDLDPDYLNDLIRDRVNTESAFSAACQLVDEIFDGSQDEEMLADSATAGMMIDDDDRRQLGQLTTRDDAGRHFYQTFDAAWLARMERTGLITIHRPVNAAAGLSYGGEYHTVEVAAEVADWFDDFGELII